MNKALFLDRDGVINEDFGYVHTKEKLQYKNGIFELVSSANKKNFLVIIITNQAGIGRGFFTEFEFNKFMQEMILDFESKHLSISDYYYCPFHPLAGIGKYKKNSYQRKPLPGMFFSAIKDHNINVKKSIMVGDKMTDIQAALSAGVKKNFLLVDDSDSDSGKVSSKAFNIINTLESVTEFINYER